MMLDNKLCQCLEGKFAHFKGLITGINHVSVGEPLLLCLLQIRTILPTHSDSLFLLCSDLVLQFLLLRFLHVLAPLYALLPFPFAPRKCDFCSPKWSDSLFPFHGYPFPCFSFGILLTLWPLLVLMSPNWLLVCGPEWSASLAEGGEPWSNYVTSTPDRGGTEGRGSPSSTELQDPSRNRRAHPNWAILGNERELCLSVSMILHDCFLQTTSGTTIISQKNTCTNYLIA